MNAYSWVIGAGLVAIAASAHGQTATFDTFNEGLIGTEFVEAGIRFFNYDNRLDPPPSNMVAERALDGLQGQPEFTPPNALGFGGYVPGDGVGFSRFGALEMSVESIATLAIVNVYTFGSSNTDKTLTLEAYDGMNLVGTDSVMFPGGFSVEHWMLTISDVAFDRIRLVAGPTEEDVVFIVADTITMTLEGGLVLDEPVPGLSGTTNTLAAHGAGPGERVYFVYGLESGATEIPGCPGVVVDIASPTLAGSDVADSNGDAELTSFVPNAARNRLVLLQAVEQSTCTVSNLVEFVFE